MQPSQSDEKLVFDLSLNQFKPTARVQRYVRTIPYQWLRSCNALPGKATQVALGLWFLAGVKKSFQFRLTAEAAELAGCCRSALYKALNTLEKAGLISVERAAGSRPIVRILMVE
ncbi:MAG: helix-turn-helix transcriptional regulator [Comamonas sp.]|nr:helix-turn-helix transcriptional regulator [Comamonas sp.]